MKRSFILLGALTSKPYAFTARSWELKSIETIDLFDSLGSNLRIDIRGSSIMRILPQNNDIINEEWISDKARYSYDGLKRERFINPMLKKKNVFIQTSWKEAFEHVANNFNKFDNLIINTGNFNDIEHFISLNKFVSNLSENFSLSINSYQKINGDLQEYYTINSNLLSISSPKVYIFIGTNLRLENPVLNIRFRKLSFDKNALIGYIGCYSDYNLNLIHLGNNLNVLNRIVKGRHPFCSIILNFLKKNSKNQKIQNIFKNKIEVLFGKEIIHTQQHTNFIELIKELNSLPLEFSFNSLELYSGLINMKELGFYNNNKINLAKKNLFYLLNTETVKNKKKNDFVIFQGHHNKKSRLKFDVIFPSSVWIEKSSLYLNCFGMLQRTQFVNLPPMNVRDDWKITTIFWTLFLSNKNEKYNNFGNFQTNNFLQLILEDIEKLFPDFLKNNTNNINRSLNWTKSSGFNKTGKISLMPIKSLIFNYYKITSVERASKIMNKCTESFIQKKTNFLNKN